MRIIKCCFVFVILVSLLTSCSNNGGAVSMNIAQPEQLLSELVSKVYTSDQLSEIVKFRGSMKEFNSQYPIECIRESEYAYRVAYLGSESVAIIFFNRDGEHILGRIYKLFPSKSNFESLSIGEPLDDVKQMDPDGEYMFLYTGSNDAPRTSTHCTKDGYWIEIEYTEDNLISSINIEPI